MAEDLKAEEVAGLVAQVDLDALDRARSMLWAVGHREEFEAVSDALVSLRILESLAKGGDMFLILDRVLREEMVRIGIWSRLAIVAEGPDQC